MAFSNDLKKQVIVVGVGLVGAYVVYRFIAGSVKETAKAAVDGVKQVVTSGYDSANAGVNQLNSKLSEASGVNTGSQVLDTFSNYFGPTFLSNYAAKKVKDGVSAIYNWVTDSEDDPKINVYDDSSKTVNGIPIYIVKPEGAPQSIFTLESLSKDIPFLNVK